MPGFWQRRPTRLNQEVFLAIRLGDEARDRKDWHAAVRHYGDAVAKNPKLTHIIVQRGHALKELGDYDGAAAAYAAALERLGDDDDLHLQIGHLEKLRNNFEQAIRYYKRAVDLNPLNYNARSELEALRYRLSEAQPGNAAGEARLPRVEDDGGLPVIAVKVTGGVGDYVVIARYLRDLQRATEPFKFDIFCNYQKSAQWVFSKLQGYRNCYSEFLFDHFLSRYALALRISQYVILHQEAANWFALKDFPRLVDVIERIVQFRPDIEVFVERHPFMDGFLAQKAVYMNCSRANFLHRISGIDYGGDPLAVDIDSGVVEKFGLQEKSYITIHNGFDPGIIIRSKAATKCYPFYGEVQNLIKKAAPHIKIVQLGTSNSLSIEGVDLNLIGETALPEAAGLISKACLHLDNESGLVHLAAALGVRSCVLFGPTSVEYFGYGSNINLVPKFCGGCWWITDTWMEECPRGFAEARCMTAHDPSAVAAAVLGAIRPNDRLPASYPPTIRVVASQRHETAG